MDAILMRCAVGMGARAIPPSHSGIVNVHSHLRQKKKHRGISAERAPQSSMASCRRLLMFGAPPPPSIIWTARRRSHAGVFNNSSLHFYALHDFAIIKLLS